LDGITNQIEGGMIQCCKLARLKEQVTFGSKAEILRAQIGRVNSNFFRFLKFPEVESSNDYRSGSKLLKGGGEVSMPTPRGAAMQKCSF